MSKTATLKLRSRVRLEPAASGREGLVVDIQSAALCRANPTGWELLGALRAGASVEQLVGMLTRDYAVDDATARHDVAAFLRQLRAVGVLHGQA
jgi:hypothetical protein